ncbi:MAG TPA: hypothetical protein VMM13_10060 [Euzebya sp.]|nr:hypothetical protein [Euzebya sp.]
MPDRPSEQADASSPDATLQALADRIELALAAVEGVGLHTEELTAQLRTAVAHAQQRVTEVVESATGRLQRAADNVQDVQAAAAQMVTATTQSQTSQLADAVAQVSTGLQQLTASAADVDQRLRTAADRVQDVTDTTATRMERLSDAALARIIADVAELITRLQDATGASEERLVAAVTQIGEQLSTRVDAATGQMDADTRGAVTTLTDAVRAGVAEVVERAAAVGDTAARDSATHTERLAAAAEELTRTVAAVVTQLDTRTAGVAGAAGQLADASISIEAAATQLDAVATRFTTSTEAAIDRSGAVADIMVQRFTDLMDAAVQTTRQATADDIQTLTTTVSWANHSLQGLIEHLIEDLSTTSMTAVQRVEVAGEAARSRLVDLVDDIEGRLLEEVRRALMPLTVETGRVAEQQSDLAETASQLESLMGQREAEAARRDAAAARMEEAVVGAAEMVAAGTGQLRDEQEAGLDRARQVAEQLADGSDQTVALMGQLDAVSERLEAATAAADASRQSLERLVTRAEELAADAAARRRRALAVPPPEG